MKTIIKRKDAIKIVRGGGCLSAFGIPFFIMGLVFFLSTLGSHHQQFHNDFLGTALLLLVSIALMVAGIGMMFGRSHLVIERNATAIEHYFVLLFRKKWSSFPYKEIEALILSRELIPQKDPAVVANYILEAKGKDKRFVILEHPDAEVVRLVAQDIAFYTGAKLENSEVLPEPRKPLSTPVSDYSFAKDSGKRAGNRFSIVAFWVVFLVVSFVMSTSDNWSWDRLQDYRNNIVYVEFPDPLFTYNEPGLYAYPLLFYHYKPSFFGNDEKQTVELNASHYQLILNALDSPSEHAVLIEGNKIRIKSIGHYLVRLNVLKNADSAYSISYEFHRETAQTLLLKPVASDYKWVTLPLTKVPQLLREKATLLDQYFPAVESSSLTILDDVLFLNASIHYHVRGTSGSKYKSDYYQKDFGQEDSLRWASPRTPIINSFLSAHDGLIYSFGGHSQVSLNEPMNWIYDPRLKEWNELLPAPTTSTSRKNRSAKVVAVYSVSENLFVMLQLRGREHAIYQFDRQTKAQWKLDRNISLPLADSKWEYLDKNTLYSYQTTYSNDLQAHYAIPDYIQLLDLNSFQVTTLSTMPELTQRNHGSILSPKRPVVRLFAYEGTFYSYFEGVFYLREENFAD